MAVSALLAVALTALAAGAGRGDDPPAKDADREKEIAALEKQLADLQAKLKALKEPKADPKAVTPAEEVIPAAWVNKFQWRCIGPATMGGRITAIAVYEADPTTYWVATASGGLLKTTNNGITFEHQFDREATVSIGDVAVAPSNKDIVWVGTGENNPRNSVSFGDGVYKSHRRRQDLEEHGPQGALPDRQASSSTRRTRTSFTSAPSAGCTAPASERGLFKTDRRRQDLEERPAHVDDKTGVIDIADEPGRPGDAARGHLGAEARRVRQLPRRRPSRRPPAGPTSYDPVKKSRPRAARIYKTTDGGKTLDEARPSGLPTVQPRPHRPRLVAQGPEDRLRHHRHREDRQGKPPAQAYLGIQGETPRAARCWSRRSRPTAPAAKAGLKEGDIITAIDGKRDQDLRGDDRRDPARRSPATR